MVFPLKKINETCITGIYFIFLISFSNLVLNTALAKSKFSIDFSILLVRFSVQ